MRFWYNIAVCTVKNSWWRTADLSETCRVLFQKQIWKISESNWLYYKNLYFKLCTFDITLLCVQWKNPDDGQRNCPKHVEFYSKNKSEKLMNLIGCIIRIYHEARSPERQIKTRSYLHLISF